MGKPTIKEQSKAKEEEVKVQEVKKEEKKNKGEKRKSEVGMSNTNNKYLYIWVFSMYLGYPKYLYLDPNNLYTNIK